jgi:hypothetical protein
MREGDARGMYLGTYHWRKQKHAYLSECEAFRQALSDFRLEWDVVTAPIQQTIVSVGGRLRPATWDGVESAVPLVRSWQSTDSFALIPHEDASQCSDPGQLGFEAQQVLPERPVCSLNLCIDNQGGGELVLWDHIPTQREKESFGTQLEGGPYPIDLVSGADSVRLSVEPGDLYIFNGEHIHAVTASVSARATVSCLLGRLPTGDVVMWT